MLMPSPAGNIAAAVESERDNMQALLEALTEERQSLRAGETDRLTDLGSRKRELLLHIAQLGEHRSRLLRNAGFSPDPAGMRALLNSSAATDELRMEWRRLLELTRDTRQLNEENGIFIEAGMRANQQALSVLVSAASGNTYGAGGRTTNPLTSRTLASA